MEEFEPPSENKPPSQPKLIAWKSIAAAIAATTAFLISIQELTKQVPPTMAAIENAWASVFKTSLSPPAAPRGGMDPPRSSDVTPAPATLPIDDPDLGPSPGPSCHIFVFTDSSVYPPKTIRSWKC